MSRNDTHGFGYDEEIAVFNTEFDAITEILLKYDKRLNTADYILDFGCSSAIAALRFAIECPGVTVKACDIDDRYFARVYNFARRELSLCKLPDNLEVSICKDGRIPFDCKFDLIYSWSAFEHINRNLIEGVIDDIKSKLADDGFLFVQIYPFYFSARGGHFAVNSIFDEPWTHLSMQHDDLKKAVLEHENYDGYWETYEALNRITARELCGKFEESGFDILYKQIGRDTENTDSAAYERLKHIYNPDVLLETGISLLMQKRI